MNGNGELSEKDLEGITAGYPGSAEVRGELAKNQAAYINSLGNNGELTEEELSQVANNMTPEELDRVLNGGGRTR